MSRRSEVFCPETGYGVHSKLGRKCKCEPCMRLRADALQDYRKRHPDYVKSNNLKAYGLSIEQWRQMVEDQNNLCAVCHQPEICHNQHGLMALAVDHNHSTGAVRKLLCHRCNRALGLLGDDAERVQKLADYRRSFE